MDRGLAEEKVCVLRLKTHGHRFEIAVWAKQYMAYEAVGGAPTTEHLRMRLQPLRVFCNAHRRDMAPHSSLMEAFDTADLDAVSARIIQLGDVIETDKQRQRLRQDRDARAAAVRAQVHHMLVSPFTGVAVAEDELSQELLANHTKAIHALAVDDGDTWLCAAHVASSVCKGGRVDAVRVPVAVRVTATPAAAREALSFAVAETLETLPGLACRLPRTAPARPAPAAAPKAGAVEVHVPQAFAPARAPVAKKAVRFGDAPATEKAPEAKARAEQAPEVTEALEEKEEAEEAATPAPVEPTEPGPPAQPAPAPAASAESVATTLLVDAALAGSPQFATLVSGPLRQHFDAARRLPRGAAVEVALLTGEPEVSAMAPLLGPAGELTQHFTRNEFDVTRIVASRHMPEEEHRPEPTAASAEPREAGKGKGKKNRRGKRGDSSDDEAPAAAAATHYSKKTHKELQKLCKARGFSTGGGKPDLISRLSAADE